jgi:hypothetical protein
MLNGAVNITQAKFNVMDGATVQSSVDIQFNPASLQYTIENTLSEPSKDGVQRQYVTQSSGKLTMDLYYDTTDTGADVRSKTQEVAKLMEPVNQGSNKNVPPTVQFEWGTYTFTGLVQTYKETIDYFSANGVPLRASINLTIASQSGVFQEVDPNKPAQAAQVTPTSSFDSATSVAQRGGDPSAARALASANGLDSMRFTLGATVAVGGGVSLKGPVAFASASAGAGGGIGIGGGAGVSLGGGAGVGVGVSVGGGAGVGVSVQSGTSASSAGVPATAGAFAGLRASASAGTQSLASLNVTRISAQVPLNRASTATGASFGIGGVSLRPSSPGLSANVGASKSLSDVLQFGE